MRVGDFSWPGSFVRVARNSPTAPQFFFARQSSSWPLAGCPHPRQRDYVNSEVNGVESINPGIIAYGGELAARIHADQVKMRARDNGSRRLKHCSGDRAARLVWACAARVSVKLRQASSLYRVFSYLPVLSLEPRREEPVQALDTAKRARSRVPSGYCWFPPLLPEDTFLAVLNTTLEAGSVRIW